MLRSETLYETPKKRIGLSVWKDSRGCLVMHLQEWDRDAQGFESFSIFGSWAPTIARLRARATKAAVQRFYDANAPEARRLASDRAAFLEGRLPSPPLPTPTTI